MVLLHDLSFIERRSQDTRNYLIGLIAVLGLVIAFITVVVAQLSWRGWVNGTRALMRGEGLLSPLLATPPELAPFAADLRARLRDMEDEYRRAQGPDAEWTAERLRTLLRTQLSGDQVIVVSNREPYIHERTATGVVVKRPASGLVTAVEPVMRACSGTWVAHGSGSADRDVVDAEDRVLVPPGQDDYWLRRIWLTAEEEQGYYYGFANEGMWPLCHVAHVRPVFRESDWAAYRAVNQRFADAVVAEARSEDPVVLVQDYHFALLPAMIREKLPQATILTFWHIPWPNPESFGICPWRREILQGMLGSTILGFHTRYHCKNFIETVDRYLEARIEHEHSTISFQEKDTLVESYPISIEWPDAAEVAAWAPVAQCRQRVIDRLGLPTDVCLAVGVDRFDYTKGILERLNAVERLLEKWPSYVGRFVFVQVAAPTRSALDEYRSFQERIERVTERINKRFGRRRLPACPPAGTAPRTRRGDGTVPCSGHLHGDQPARRHEPGVQGVRRRARRPARGADPQPLRGRRARTFGGADRESVSRRRDGRRAAPGRHDARRRATRAHGEPAQHGARVQRLPLGRAHVGRRRAMAPAFPHRSPRAQPPAALTLVHA